MFCDQCYPPTLSSFFNDKLHFKKGLFLLSRVHPLINNIVLLRLSILCLYLGSYTGSSCFDILHKGLSHGDGYYVIDPQGDHEARPFVVYCDMTSFGGGWTMCYTTDNFVNMRTEPQNNYIQKGISYLFHGHTIFAH